MLYTFYICSKVCAKEYDRFEYLISLCIQWKTFVFVTYPFFLSRTSRSNVRSSLLHGWIFYGYIFFVASKYSFNLYETYSLTMHVLVRRKKKKNSYACFSVLFSIFCNTVDRSQLPSLNFMIIIIWKNTHQNYN